MLIESEATTAPSRANKARQRTTTKSPVADDEQDDKQEDKQLNYATISTSSLDVGPAEDDESSPENEDDGDSTGAPVDNKQQQLQQIKWSPSDTGASNHIAHQRQSGAPGTPVSAEFFARWHAWH